MMNEVLDVAIVGAGPSGLSAALVLGRQLWNVAVIDDGRHRNKTAHEAYSYLTRDGCAPSDLLSAAMQDVRKYRSVSLFDGTVSSIERLDSGFRVGLDARHLTSRAVILATGLTDVVDAVDGLSERFGDAVFHCLLCHGYEVRGHPVGVIGDSEVAMFQASYLAAKFSDKVSLVTNSDRPMSAESVSKLHQAGVDVISDRLTLISGSVGNLRLHFRSGLTLTKYAAFYHAIAQQRSTLPERLGCEFLLDGRVKVDCFQSTSVPGVLAVGDMARQESMLGNMMFIANAVASGVRGAAWLDEHLYLCDASTGDAS